MCFKVLQHLFYFSIFTGFYCADIPSHLPSSICTYLHTLRLFFKIYWVLLCGYSLPHTQYTLTSAQLYQHSKLFLLIFAKCYILLFIHTHTFSFLSSHILFYFPISLHMFYFVHTPPLHNYINT
jgi:hypothetical protein